MFFVFFAPHCYAYTFITFKKEEAPKAATPAVSPISHHDIDTSKLKKPLSPAVLSLVLKYGIKDVGSIEPSGYGGRILKGDVLAHLGMIKPKPAPHPTLSIAPPRDQIVFAKVTKKKNLHPSNRLIFFFFIVISPSLPRLLKRKSRRKFCLLSLVRLLLLMAFSVYVNL